jgi:hypothetical protein
MKHTITLLMSIATLALSGCVTTKGFYVVDAYDAKGEKPQIIGDRPRFMIVFRQISNKV